MKSILFYELKVVAYNSQMVSKSTHRIVANSYEEAKAHVINTLTCAGYQEVEVRGHEQVIYDIREEDN